MTEGSVTWCLLKISVKQSSGAELAESTQRCHPEEATPWLLANRKLCVPVPTIKCYLFLSNCDSPKIFASLQQNHTVEGGLKLGLC